MLIDAHRSQLLVVDLQERLLPAIHDHERVVANVVWMIRVAQKIGVPVAAVEQYAKGLGRTVQPVRELLPPEGDRAERAISLASPRSASPTLPGSDRAQIVLVGIESARLPAADGARADRRRARRSSSSPTPSARGARSDRDLALARMRQEGARIVSREMVVFEWLARAATPLFREVSREFLRG